MARWRLLKAHYIPVKGTFYRFTQVAQATGKQHEENVEVPRLLDPEYPGDQNYPGDIIVARPGSGFPKDIEFLGQPTPDMEPLDDEAKALSDAMLAKMPAAQFPMVGATMEEMLIHFMSNGMAMPAPGSVVADGAENKRIETLEKELVELKDLLRNLVPNQPAVVEPRRL